MCQARESRSHKISEVERFALVIADLLIKEGVINVNPMMTSYRFTATRDDDNTAVHQLPEDVEDKEFREGLT